MKLHCTVWSCGQRGSDMMFEPLCLYLPLCLINVVNEGWCLTKGSMAEALGETSPL